MLRPLGWPTVRGAATTASKELDPLPGSGKTSQLRQGCHLQLRKALKNPESNNALTVLLDSEEEYCIGTPYGYCEQAIWIPLCRRLRTASAKLGPTLQGVVGT
eukprot:jgi/Botrbrau1/875/Bobra.0352s0064.1